jgi:hypothetical protein
MRRLYLLRMIEVLTLRYGNTHWAWHLATRCVYSRMPKSISPRFKEVVGVPRLNVGMAELAGIEYSRPVAV